MDILYWQKRWQNCETGFHTEQVSSHLKSFWSKNDLVYPHVFVPLCGKSLDMLWLRNQGASVTGVEVSPLAVESFFAENNLSFNRQHGNRLISYQAGELRLWLGDIFDLSHEHLQGVNMIYDRAALVALPPEQRKKYAKHLLKLCPGADQLLVSVEYDAKKMDGPPYAVSYEEIEHLYPGANIVRLFYEDVLPSTKNMQNRGLSEFFEAVYHLRWA